MNQSSKQTGVVTKWDNQRKYGFVRTDSGIHVFIHSSGIKASPISDSYGSKSLAFGQKARFNVVSTPRGLKATDLEVIEE